MSSALPSTTPTRSIPLGTTTVSVALLTANRQELLLKTIASLERQTRPPDELVIIVNESGGETAALLANVSLSFTLRVIENPGSTDFAAARNKAVEACTGSIIAFLDDDCEADRFWLERLTSRLVVAEADAVGGSVLPAESIDTPDDHAPELCWAAGLLPQGWFSPLAGRLVLPTTANLCAWRDVFVANPFQSVAVDKGDGFDYLAGREDAEWWSRLRLAGRPLAVERRAIVWHHIPSERLGRLALDERLVADGRAHWARTKNKAYLAVAARDLAYSPMAIYQGALHNAAPFRQVLRGQLAWNKRQAAYLAAAVDDINDGISPPQRAGLLLKASGSAAIDAVKSAASFMVRAGSDAFRRTKELPTVENPPKSLLVVQHDNLGDAVLAIPMLRQLEAAFPEARLSMICGPATEGILSGALSDRWHFIILNGAQHGTSLKKLKEMHRRASKPLPDAVLLVYTHFLSAMPFFFLNQAPVLAWAYDNGLKLAHRGLIDVPVEKDFRRHEIINLLDLLGPFGIRTQLESPRLFASKYRHDRIDKILSEAGVERGGYAVVQVEAARRFKSWPEDRYKSVINLLEQRGLTVFLDGARGDREVARFLAKGRKRCHVLHGLLSAAELVALLGGARIFVGIDSGPAHVAQAVSCPAVILFGALETVRWGPLPEVYREGLAPVRVVAAAPGDWCGDELTGCAVNHSMRLLPAETVCAAISEVLSLGERKSYYPD